MVGVASAARLHRGDVSLGVAEPSPLLNDAGQQEQQQQRTGVVEKPQGRVIRDLAGTLTLSPACSAAYKLLDDDKGYQDAISTVFDAAREVGKAVGKKCLAGLHPSLAPLGGVCKADAEPFWDEDDQKQSDLQLLVKVSEAALSPSEAAPLVWLDEEIVTKSPFPFLPTLGIGMKFNRILPFFLPTSCDNDADVAEVLAYFGDGCVKEEEPNLKKCKFTRAS